MNNNIEKLEKRIQALKKQPEEKNTQGTGVNILVELTAGITVGVFLGYIVDSYLNTLSLFLFIFIVLGLLGGILNLYKVGYNNKRRK